LTVLHPARSYDFFFEWYRYHRDLHSFPTRRSSDLPLGGGDHYGGIITWGDFEVSDLGGLIEALEQAKPGDVVYIPDEHVIDLTRSEEHTSELQSRENLVCRLLLEKKKKKKTKIRTQ